jgi:hypothetical protein
MLLIQPEMNSQASFFPEPTLEIGWNVHSRELLIVEMIANLKIKRADFNWFL